MSRDWSKYRRWLSLPNGEHRNAGKFGQMLLWLLAIELQPGDGLASDFDICHTAMFNALFQGIQRGLVWDRKRNCVWALNLDSRRSPQIDHLPDGPQLRYITTEAHNWHIALGDARWKRSYDIRTPEGRLRILDVVTTRFPPRMRRLPLPLSSASGELGQVETPGTGHLSQGQESFVTEKLDDLHIVDTTGVGDPMEVDEAADAAESQDAIASVDFVKAPDPAAE